MNPNVPFRLRRDRRRRETPCIASTACTSLVFTSTACASLVTTSTCTLRAVLAACVLLSGCWRTQSQPSESHAAANDFKAAESVVAEADRMASRNLWPGFVVTNTPIAIFDGTQTWMFRHPSPPDSFVAVLNTPKAHVYRGRYHTVSANSSAEIGGVLTATLMPAGKTSTLRSRAGVLTHELFHVYQRTHHPSWSANEAELFMYPTDNVGLLEHQRVETVALRRAINAHQRDTAACWTRAALNARAHRFSAMTPGAVQYERNTELNEGLATYVEYRAIEAPNSTVLPAMHTAPDAIRLRAYQTGVAWARLLDQFRPAWRDALTQRDSTSLDVLLSEHMATMSVADIRVPPCNLSQSERQSLSEAAGADIATMYAQYQATRNAFLEQTGWQVVVVAAKTPLFPQEFDPLNVQRLSASDVLHARFVKLGNDSVSIEVIGRASLSEAAGDHPLFSGVRTFRITGLTSEPVILNDNGVISLRTTGVSGVFRGASVEREAQTITIRLSK